MPPRTLRAATEISPWLRFRLWEIEHTMGDWTKGEFAVVGKVPGKDYLCVYASENGYILNSHSFGVYTPDRYTPDRKEARELLARTNLQNTFKSIARSRRALFRLVWTWTLRVSMPARRNRWRISTALSKQTRSCFPWRMRWQPQAPFAARRGCEARTAA